MIYIFDESLGKRLPKILSILDQKTQALCDGFAEPGEADTDWMARLDPAAHVLVTSDGKIRTRAYERDVWKERGVTVICLDATLHGKMQILERTWRVLKAWLKVRETVEKSPGGYWYGLRASGELERRE